MNKYKLSIDTLITIDDNGMPKAPSLRQLLDKDVRELYISDKTPDKSQYVKECIVIYYLGDPNSPARQNGLSDAEALQMAIEQAGLEKSYKPSKLVISLYHKYYEQNITEAGKVVENIIQGLHNINLSIGVINEIVNSKFKKLKINPEEEDISTILTLMNNVNQQSKELPAILKRLEEAKENLMYEKETQLSRGGNRVVSSMDAEEYMND